MSGMPVAKENPPPGEAAYTQDLAERLKAKIIKDNPTGIMRRDAHPKMHGVVKAEFIIEPDLPDDLRVGVFRRPATYPAWVRLSNQDGTIQPDSKGDIRGMAIKLMGVEGEKLLEAERAEQTQDFILISTNVFVTKDVEDFDQLIQAFTGSLFQKLAFSVTHPRVVCNLLKSMKQHANPLQIRYWSTTPYLFGDHAVKYSAIPTGEPTDGIPAQPTDNFLQEAMARQLATGDAFFDFAVQFQTDTFRMPIEDPGKEWSERASPFRKVATIRIPMQSFDRQQQVEFGENLSFSPWHSLPEHRPLGGINRSRKLVYEVISRFRHTQNNAPRREPTSWEI